jgi:TATA-box binding protein (TBP) (component of TFIID and TFIIIB)
MGKQAVLNIFGTGKVVLTGLKSMDEIASMFNSFLNKAVNEKIFW